MELGYVLAGVFALVWIIFAVAERVKIRKIEKGEDEK